jgi:BASS family bile acid:Na+ symporter
MKTFSKYLFAVSGLLFVLSLGLYLSGNDSIIGPPLILFFLTLALAMRGTENFKGFSFTVLIFAAVSLSMFYPQTFVQWGDFQLKKLIVPLLQIIMFGMGTAMSFKDFYGVIKMPKGVLVGLICQFTIMPFLGFSLATLFNFPAEIAAGVVLIGSSPSGLASNVMAYLAKANVALSVTLTAVATVVAPFYDSPFDEILCGSLCSY